LFVDEIVSQTDDSLVARRTWRAEEDFYKGINPAHPSHQAFCCASPFSNRSAFAGPKVSASGKPDGVPLLAKVENVRFRNPVYPGDTTLIEVKINENRRWLLYDVGQY